MPTISASWLVYEAGVCKQKSGLVGGTNWCLVPTTSLPRLPTEVGVSRLVCVPSIRVPHPQLVQGYRGCTSYPISVFTCWYNPHPQQV